MKPDPLPVVFGKCLGLECADPEAIKIRTPRHKPLLEDNSAEILAYATLNLPLTGTLTADDRGFIYLDVPDTYIHELVPFIEAAGVTHPPYFDHLYKSGAHITVVLASEAKPELPSELLGEEIPFSLTGCYKIEPENWMELETLWFLSIHAPRLSEIRTLLGLSPKVLDHEFHITIAVKKRFVSIHDLFGLDNESLYIKKI